ncbi:class II aldolase [Oceanobacillus oncorhynchi subsp. incaldanensis]|uniref:class II aldolase/adducin family protein n=1 Tax=Oceanobacillus oncorhynchi TaxID=545501 RepID=UPI001B108C6A|nr:class II aldolase/adducin family protein [Oceanobacillus oncorhynchi]GIO19666.1 class II aldolase [Oceanobacillus oncorhynchi subsp. incaldanensis]
MDIESKIIHTGNELLQKHLTWGNSGNMSVRNNENQMIITGSGTNMGSLTEGDFVLVNIETQEWEGTRKPSKEIPMHRAIYRNRPDANVVIHASPFWSTLVACSEEVIESKLFIEPMYYLEKIEGVGYFHPGSTALGEKVGEAAKKANILFLKNHGIIVFDDSVEEAVMRLETLEFTCRMMVMAKSSGVALSVLSDDIVKDFLENSGYKGKWK